MTVSRTPDIAAVEEWLTVQDACALIGVSPATLRRWSAAGDVEAFTTPGGHRRFARSTILGHQPSARQPRPPRDSPGAPPAPIRRLCRRPQAHDCPVAS